MASGGRGTATLEPTQRLVGPDLPNNSWWSLAGIPLVASGPLSHVSSGTDVNRSAEAPPVVGIL
jgi:hypothetical protein